MKKTYQFPSLIIIKLDFTQMLAASNLKIGGDANITFAGDDEEGISGEVKSENYWDDDWSE